MLKLKNDSQYKGMELLQYMKNEMEQGMDEDDDMEDESEYEIIEILEENINATEFQVSTNAGELLVEYYPNIFE